MDHSQEDLRLQAETLAERVAFRERFVHCRDGRAQVHSALQCKTPPRCLGLVAARPVPALTPKPHSYLIRGITML